jgi:hypothetical protein
LARLLSRRKAPKKSRKKKAAQSGQGDKIKHGRRRHPIKSRGLAAASPRYTLSLHLCEDASGEYLLRISIFKSRPTENMSLTLAECNGRLGPWSSAPPTVMEG